MLCNIACNVNIAILHNGSVICADFRSGRKPTFRCYPIIPSTKQ